MYSQKALSRIEIIKKKIEFIQNIVHEKGSTIIVGLVPPNAKTRSNRKGYLLMSRIRQTFSRSVCNFRDDACSDFDSFI